MCVVSFRRPCTYQQQGYTVTWPRAMPTPMSSLVTNLYPASNFGKKTQGVASTSLLRAAIKVCHVWSPDNLHRYTMQAVIPFTRLTSSRKPDPVGLVESTLAYETLHFFFSNSDQTELVTQAPPFVGVACATTVSDSYGSGTWTITTCTNCSVSVCMVCMNRVALAAKLRL